MKYFVFCILVLLAGRVFFYLQHLPRFSDGDRVGLVAKVVKSSRVGNTQRLTVVVKGVKLFVRTTPYPMYFAGQTLSVTGTIRTTSLGKNEILTMAFPTITLVKDRSRFATWLSDIRDRITLQFEQALPPASATLLLGIVLGVKGQIDDSFYEELQMTGVLHVIAASGMNVSMVSVFLLSIFSPFLKRQVALGCAGLGIILYMLLAGFEPAIVRASIMAILAMIGSMLGRQYFSLWLLFITGMIMLFVDPGLLFEPGFQLSFSATAGIILLVPLLMMRKNVRPTGVEIVATDLRTTIAAQIATLPIMLYHFGSYGGISILANALVLWTIPLLILFGGIGALLSLTVPLLATFFLWLCLPLLWYFETVIVFLGSIPLNVEIASFPLVFVIGYYLLLLAIIRLRRRTI